MRRAMRVTTYVMLGAATATATVTASGGRPASGCGGSGSKVSSEVSSDSVRTAAIL